MQSQSLPREFRSLHAPCALRPRRGSAALVVRILTAIILAIGPLSSEAQQAVSPALVLLGATPANEGQCLASPGVPSSMTIGKNTGSVRLEFSDAKFGSRVLSVSLDSAGRSVGYTENTVYQTTSGAVRRGDTLDNTVSRCTRRNIGSIRFGAQLFEHSLRISRTRLVECVFVPCWGKYRLELTRQSSIHFRLAYYQRTSECCRQRRQSPG